MLVTYTITTFGTVFLNLLWLAVLFYSGYLAVTRMIDFNSLPEILQKFLTELNKQYKIAAISAVDDGACKEYQVACKGKVFYIYHHLIKDEWTWKERGSMSFPKQLMIEEK
jgi:hypothetical protein